MPNQKQACDEFAHFLTLFNFLGQKEAKERFAQVITAEELLSDTGLDSMDFLIVCMYFCTWYGVSNEDSKKLSGVSKDQESSPQTGLIATVQDFFDFLSHHKTKSLGRVEDCIKDYS